VAAKPKTLGELRSSGYKVQTVKQEMRRNLIEKMRKNEDVFPGIFGFEETVIPQLQNAILSGQDIIFLGERGQAKSRIIRSLVNLLDNEIPVVQGSEVNDDPFNPLSKYAQDLVAEMGDQTPVEWVGRDRRYGEKLARCRRTELLRFRIGRSQVQVLPLAAPETDRFCSSDG
jgi:magnesium chelatase subunit I